MEANVVFLEDACGDEKTCVDGADGAIFSAFKERLDRVGCWMKAPVERLEGSLACTGGSVADIPRLLGVRGKWFLD